VLPPLPVVPTVKAKLVVAYDGAGFHGFAVNAGVRTVAGTLTEAISTVARTPVTVTGAGRTDAGVHAWGQVISVGLPDGADLADLARRVNKLCGAAISIRSAEVVGNDFDARFSAQWRHYRYDVWNAPYPNPLIAARSWHVSTPLDVAAMNEAAQHVRGEHDFASFCRRPKGLGGAQESRLGGAKKSRLGGAQKSRLVEGEPEPSLVRNVLSAGWAIADAEGPVLRFEIRANAFCHQMVRSITGTLVDVGSGKLPHDAVVAILAAGDRQAAGQVAPPQGLTLWQVGY
jgi:tRNA pseudouridine38-40 synthase